MRKKLIYITLLFISIISIITLFSLDATNNEEEELNKGRQLVYLNEVRNEIEKANLENEVLNESLDKLEGEISKRSVENNNDVIIYRYFINIIFIIIIYAYTYFIIVRPFERMEKFAVEIGRGNFDIEINYEKNNLFGAFTWAFDHMRKEIIKARSCEKEAIENNKTVIATLSHDIKTPVASIRAYAEALEANLDHNVERRKKYIDVITRKCDEVTKLTNDLFLHSLSDLDRLKITTEEVEISRIIKDTLNELLNEHNEIVIKGEIPKAKIKLDKNRFVQVIENIVNNSIKYAEKSPIEVRAEIIDEEYILYIRDFGKGILDKDIPFIFDKFYRGSNVLDKQGAGLGLFIVKYIMEQLKGRVEVYNKGGLEVKLILSLKIS